MKSHPLDDQILDFIEGTLSQGDRARFEEALAKDREFASKVEGYRSILSVESLVSKESYEVSPHFTTRVTSTIAENDSSLWSRLSSILTTLSRPLAGAALIALLAIAITRRGGEGAEPGFPTMDSIAPLQVGAGSAFSGHDSRRGLSRILNSLDLPFRPGSEVPLSVSLEAIRSSSDPSIILAAASLTFQPHANKTPPSLTSIQIGVEALSPSIATISRWEDKAEIPAQIGKVIPAASGSGMAPGQQVTLLLRIRMKTSQLPQEPLIRVSGTYTTIGEGAAQRVEAHLLTSDLLADTDELSFGMKSVLDIIAPSRRF